LVDEAGYRYLDGTGNDLQVRPDGDADTAITIAPSGDVSDGRTGASLGRTIGVFRVADRDALVPTGRGRFVDPRGQDVVAVPTNAIRQGNVEASNVETVSELVSMLVVQRTFEATSTVLRGVGQLQRSFIGAVNR
jgi:flagellar basal body rod protein FlgG